MNVAEKTLNDLEHEITCAICKNYYTDPKILPCLHYYCKTCVAELARRAGQGKPFSCPECRALTILPDDGEDALKTIFVINRLKSIYDKYRKALHKQVLCEICTNSEACAEFYCYQCDKFCCKGCVHLHSVMKTAFEGHECVLIEKMNKIRIKSEECIGSNEKYNACRIHGERLKYFCFDCNKLICGDCIVRDHRGHNIEFISAAADEKKKEFKESLKSLTNVRTNLSRAIEDTNKIDCEIQSQSKAKTDEIERLFGKIYGILDTHKAQLLSKVKKITQEELEKVANKDRVCCVTGIKLRMLLSTLSFVCGHFVMRRS